jgi:hypothetical protein
MLAGLRLTFFRFAAHRAPPPAAARDLALGGFVTVPPKRSGTENSKRCKVGRIPPLSGIDLTSSF